MKRMMVDTLLTAGALAFVAILGAAVEGTMPPAAVLGLLAGLAAGMRGLWQLERVREKRTHGPKRYRPVRRVRSEPDPLRAA